MKRGFTKKVIACVTALAMTLTVFPQSQLFLRGEKAEAAEGNILTDADIDKLYSKVSYNRQSVHDPSIIKNGSDYYVFGSHMGVAKTTDLMNWDRTSISDENAENAYYGTRNADGTVTKVPFSEAFKNGSYTEVEVPFLVSETLTGTEWWNANQKGKDYSIDNNSLILYVKADALIDNYGAFSVELQGGTWFFTTGSDKNAWFAEGATGNVEGIAEEKISALTQNHTYKITITRTEQTVTVQYYDVDDNKEYCAFTGTSSNIPDALNVHVIAQVGTYTVTTEQPIEKKIIDFSSFPASDWNTAYNETVKGNMWAPDIIWNETMKKYCMYLSLNGSKFNSVVILLTSTNLEGPYVYEAPIIYSGFTNSGNTSYTKTDLSLVFNGTTDGVVDISKYLSGSVYNNTIWPHAIDPYVFYDDEGKLWMGYGSWSGGIYMIELDETTGLRDYTVKYDYKENASDPYFGKKIAGGYYVSGEGPYIEKIGSYYFLFMSYGFYSPTGGYNMRIFRSENPDGPYIDINGQNAIYTSAYPRGQNNHLVDSRGIQLMGNYQWDTMPVAEVAQGHNSAFVDNDGKAYVIYHTKFANDTADHQLRVHQLYLNEDGWIVAAPYEYAGEEVDSDIISKTPISQDKIIGDYNIIVHQYSNPKAVDEGTVANNIDIVKPVKVTLNSDGTISGAYTGTWSEKAGTAYATITIAGKTYKGVFVEQTIDGTNIKTMCFTAVNTSKGTNHCIWGSKELNDSIIVAYNAKNMNANVPENAFIGNILKFNTEGYLGASYTWKFLDENLITKEGVVQSVDVDTEAQVQLTITKGDYSYNKIFTIKILSQESKYKLIPINKDSVLHEYNTKEEANEDSPDVKITKDTGLSFSFYADGVTSDWTTILGATGALEFGLATLTNRSSDSWSNFTEKGSILSAYAKEQGYTNSSVWSAFTDGSYYVTISFNPNGSISYYRDGNLILTYASDLEHMGGELSCTVSDIVSKAISCYKNGTLQFMYDYVNNIVVGYSPDYKQVELDTSQYLYYQDYENITNINEIWTSKDASGNLKIDNDDYGKCVSYSFVGETTNSRGAINIFSYTDKNGNKVNEVSDTYTVEFDAKLKAGSGNNSQESQFAIMGKDYVFGSDGKQNMNNGLNSGYIFKITTTNSTSWTIADDSEIPNIVTISNNDWVHFKVNVSDGFANIIISNGSKELYTGKTSIKGSSSLYGLYVLAGRYQAVAKVDNVKVYWTPKEPITTVGKKNTDGTYTLSWSDYTKFYPQVLSENSQIKINFHNYSAGDFAWNNYAVAVAPVGTTAGLWQETGQWHLRADHFCSSTFGESYDGQQMVSWNCSENAYDTSLLKDAEIDLIVTRYGSNITIHTDIIGADGNLAYYEATTTKAPANGDLTLYLGGETCYLEIYDVQVFRELDSQSYEYSSLINDNVSILNNQTLTYQWYRSTTEITAENAPFLIDGTLSEATVITGATDKEYEFQAEDIEKYIAAVVTITESNGKSIKTVAALPDKVQKKKLSISESAVENKIYDGTVDAKISSITFTGTVEEDTIAYDAVAEFVDANAGTEKEVTGTVTLTEGSTDLYVLEDNTFTTKADIEKSTDTPNFPDTLIKVSNSTQKVSEVELPTDWIWNTEDTEKEIPSGGEIKATAIYNGTDKGNYVTESVEITIQRTNCVHDYSTVTYANNAITIGCSRCDSVRKVTLETGEGSIGSNYKPESTVENSILLPTGDTITKLGYTLKGWSDTASGNVKYQGETEYSELFLTSDTITLYAIWEKIEGPSGTITIANTKWDSFLTIITFGIYKSTQEEITIDAQSQNGIKAIHYIIATNGTTYTEAQLSALPETDWTVYNSVSKPKLQKDTKNVVYAKLEDNAGNIVYISSNGIIEDETVPNITEFDVLTGELTDSSVSLSAKGDEDGTYYFVLCKDSEDDLSDKAGSDLAAAIIAKAKKSGAITTGQMITITEKGLEKATNYNAYIAIRDAAGNASSRVCYFTTAQAMLELTNPTITGTVVYNSDLVADAKNKENLEDYSYQWYRSSSPITADTNISSLELIGKAVRGEYTIQREDIGKYIAVTIALAHETYAGSCRAYTTEPVQPKTVTATVSIKDKEYDGTTDAEISEITLDGIVAKDQGQVTVITGTAIFADAGAGNDKEVTISNIGLTGKYASCYQLEQSTIKTVGNIIKAKVAPNMPNAENVWNVSRDITKVGTVTLPTDWIWLAEDAEKELPIETIVKATAVYNGKDKGNYEIESVEISIQRSSCVHAETEIRNEKQATCTEAGYSGDTYCKTCEQLVSAGNTIAALGHSFIDYKENGDATCTEDGTKTAKCERCDETKTIISEGSKKGHTIVIDPAVEPSCTAIGKTKGSHCSACGEILEEQKGIAALGHDYTSEVTKKPTVTETGIRTYTCSRCNDSYTEEIPKLPEEEHEHQYTKSITKEPTCTVEGVITYVCSCGDQYTEAIKALGHNYNVVITKPATTTETGIKTFTCSRCDDSYTEEIPKLSEGHEHKYTESITKEPTCTEEGVKTFVCDCGEKYTEKIEVLGHDYEAVITKPATVTEAGIKTYTCKRCDKSYTEEIPKLSEEHEHKYTEKVTKEATCTEEGVKTFTCSCGEEYTEVIKALGHDYKSEITKPATVTETGIETFTCSRCNDSYTKEIPKLTQPLPPSGNTGSNGGSSGGTTGTTGNNSNNNTQTNDTNTGDTDNTGTTQKPEDTSNETPSQTITTETKPDGTIVETVKEQQPDGTKVETVTETKPNGTIVSTATETKTDGSVTSTKEIQLEDKSASLFTVVETTANGSVNVNSVIRTGLSDTSDTVNISEELLKDVAEDERLNSIIVEITDTTVNSATKESKKTIVNVNIPSVEGVAVEKVVLTKDSIEAAKNTGKGLVVNVTNGCADKGTISNYKVTIPAKQLAKIDSNIQEINVEIIAEPVTNVSNVSKKNAITKIVNKNKGKEKKTCVVSLASNENVKAGMNVTIPVTDKTKITKGSKVYVYKYNAKTGKLVETANCKKTVSKDGTVTIAASSGKDYVISAKKLSGNKVQTIKDSISMSISKKTAKAGKTINVKISLPDTVSTKSKFGTEKANITYKSSDSKVASVSKSGVITTKKKGTVVVTATVKLASGQKVTKKQEITIK